ncbi:unannotated protein [freshwater metagenome]|uniref:Unannotated protein n=1 Tax=freshwater metagenome TaxID=449393 RepID=A0A6J6IDY5_9ZZZZ
MGHRLVVVHDRLGGRVDVRPDVPCAVERCGDRGQDDRIDVERTTRVRSVDVENRLDVAGVHRGREGHRDRLPIAAGREVLVPGLGCRNPERKTELTIDESSGGGADVCGQRVFRTGTDTGSQRVDDSATVGAVHVDLHVARPVGSLRGIVDHRFVDRRIVVLQRRPGGHFTTLDVVDIESDADGVHDEMRTDGGISGGCERNGDEHLMPVGSADREVLGPVRSRTGSSVGLEVEAT